jgi:Protein of unknown function with HXXEE motif
MGRRNRLLVQSPSEAASWHTRAWLLLVGALALHVADEALTGFLDVYNPLVLDIRSRVSWFPMPTFTFGTWITGLVVLVAVLAGMARAVRRAAPATVLASWVFSLIMFMNGIGHLAGSVYFQRWLPGATSAPLLLAASVLLAVATWHRSRSRSGV